MDISAERISRYKYLLKKPIEKLREVSEQFLITVFRGGNLHRSILIALALKVPEI